MQNTQNRNTYTQGNQNGSYTQAQGTTAQAVNQFQQAQFQDKEILNDALIAEKHLSASYNTFVGECVSEQLRNTFMSVLDDTHRIQNCIFKDMQSRGWYQVEQADKNKVQQAKQKLTAQC